MEAQAKLPGEGDIKVVRKVRMRVECENCGEPATYRNTYLNDGGVGARRNPASAAYGRDDCTWCSDHDQFLCGECHQKRHTIGVPGGFLCCSTFEISNRFAHMFLEWWEEELPNGMCVVFDGPPDHDDAPRFVEVEDGTGRSINAGEWRKRSDGYWELAILQPVPAPTFEAAE